MLSKDQKLKDIVFDSISPPNPKIGKMMAFIFGVAIGSLITWKIRSQMDE